MKAKDETLPFLFAFTLLFGLFYGMGLLAANVDWTWSRILICLVTVSGVAIAWTLLGIIVGVGIAEETLFRGYVFNFLRRGRIFWKAATLSMILFGAMHLILLLWLPLPITIAAIILAIIAAYPSAYLFEAGNQTIWAPAILHTTALATNLFEIPAELAIPLSLMWIGVVMIGLFLVFVAEKLVPTKLTIIDRPTILEELQAVIKEKK
jgi:membrane protease YdiL (CAAX protease family)